MCSWNYIHGSILCKFLCVLKTQIMYLSAVHVDVYWSNSSSVATAHNSIIWKLKTNSQGLGLVPMDRKCGRQLGREMGVQSRSLFGCMSWLDVQKKTRAGGWAGNLRSWRKRDLHSKQKVFPQKWGFEGGVVQGGITSGEQKMSAPEDRRGWCLEAGREAFSKEGSEVGPKPPRPFKCVHYCTGTRVCVWVCVCMCLCVCMAVFM